jgi:hypothetical protein
MKTFGEKLVGIDFNPSNNDKVFEVKSTFAQMANMLKEHMTTLSNEREAVLNQKDIDDFTEEELIAEDDFNKLYSIVHFQCIAKILDCQMHIVKLLTLKP